MTVDVLPDFSDLLAPSTDCRNHCIVYKLLAVMDDDRASKVVAAINAHDIGTKVMARRFRDANLAISEERLTTHRDGQCRCCEKHGTLG